MKEEEILALLRLQKTPSIGDIVFEPHPIYLGHFLNACIGNATSTLQTSAYQHEFIPRQDDFDANFALQPYTVALFKNVGSSYQYTDAMIHTLAIEITAGGIINATATVHARGSALLDPTTASFILSSVTRKVNRSNQSKC